MKELFKEHHQKLESQISNFWDNQQIWKHKKQLSPDNCFSVILPPPNITGQLHLGHALDSYIPDTIARFYKLQKKEILFIGGTDHAGIATQVKVEQYIQATTKQPILAFSQDYFLKVADVWRINHQKRIHEQWKKLGLILNPEYERFTFDEDYQTTVSNVFIDLYNKGLIYQSNKLIHWDCVLRTAISNTEVIYEEQESELYFIKYYFTDSNLYLTIATTRPETIFSDVAILYNPDDPRFTKLRNKSVINPLTGKSIPILSSDKVEIEFGTGLLKLTPAHDFLDNEINKELNLPVISCINFDGTLNNEANEFAGMDRIKAKKFIVDKLFKTNHLVKIEKNVNRIMKSQRTGSIIEPLISKQWFLNTKQIIKNQKLIEIQKSLNNPQKVKFYPERFNQILLNWLNNIEDWCISRQLWWGHQLPIWYKKNSKKKEVKASIKKPGPSWVQEKDVLDTWFSSAIWPLALHDWKSPEDNLKLMNNAFFPNSLLVTGHDILLFWVIRMMFQSLELTQSKPFQKVLIHGLIRDKYGNKMSKSLGNGVDPMIVINEYGSDALRLYLITHSTPGLDIKYNTQRLKESWQIVNKLKNLTIFFKNKIVQFSDVNSFINMHLSKTFAMNNHYFILILTLEFEKFQENVKKHTENFNFNLVKKEIKNFFWDFFCNTLTIEINRTNSKSLIAYSLLLFNKLLKELHPFMPFLTESIYQDLFLYGKSILLDESDKWDQLQATSFKQINLNKFYFFKNSLLYDLMLDFKVKLTNLMIKQQVKFTWDYSNFIKKIAKDTGIKDFDKDFIKLSEDFNIYWNFQIYNANFTIKQLPIITNKYQIRNILGELIENYQFEVNRSKKILENENFKLNNPNKYAENMQKSILYTSIFQILHTI